MTSPLFHIDAESDLGLRDQLRQKLVSAILSGTFLPGERLPSSRKLSEQLGIARNTVTLAYQQLVDEGYLISRERSGLYVNEALVKGRADFARVAGRAETAKSTVWRNRVKAAPPAVRRFRFPPNWQSYPFPFVDGRFDRSLFPAAEWREANRLALGLREIHQWSTDSGESDDRMLIEEIRTKILPRRGIQASPDEILVTVGAQHALHLLIELLTDATTPCAVEEPGSPDMRELLLRRGVPVVSQHVDQEGMVVDGALDRCAIVHVTPSHQRPTGAVMSVARRKALLAKADAHDFVIIEDDYEFDVNADDAPIPALRSIDAGNRVVYVASLSKVLAPSLRLGFMVAPPEIIAEARRLRQLTTRNPPLNNQRTAALFLSLGHYNSTVVRTNRVFHDRLIALRDALNHYLPQLIAIDPIRSGTTYWVRGPATLNVPDLIREAEARGVLIEPVAHYFARADAHENVFRMGITSLPIDRIRAGVAALAEIIRDVMGGVQPAAEQGVWLTGSALREAMAGATLLYKTVYGEPCSIELLPDGTMTGRAGYADEDRDTGRWWIEDDRWFRQWNNWAYGEPIGFHTTLDGDRVRWFNADRRLIDSAVISRP